MWLVEVVTWDRGTEEPADNYTLFSENDNVNHHLWKGILIHKIIIQAGKRADFVKVPTHIQTAGRPSPLRQGLKVIIKSSHI
jgi:hypothetical protein